MACGTDKLMRQIAGRGYFAEVTVDVEVDRLTEQLSVTFDDSYATAYRTAAHFGTEYAWEQYAQSRGERRGLKVHIVEIQWQPVDTSAILVAFVAVRATWAALGWNPLSGPQFDEVSGSVVFPKMIKG